MVVRLCRPMRRLAVVLSATGTLRQYQALAVEREAGQKDRVRAVQGCRRQRFGYSVRHHNLSALRETSREGTGCLYSPECLEGMGGVRVRRGLWGYAAPLKKI
jgi:hypothetical protein